VVNGYIVSFGGLFGNSISKGNTIIPFIADKEKLMEICDAAIQFFAENANAGERFKFTLDRVGWDKFEERIQEVYHG
jgi:dissimilatory sulfite reductase (desulfoviridin) alpha/beta subunit